MLLASRTLAMPLYYRPSGSWLSWLPSSISVSAHVRAWFCRQQPRSVALSQQNRPCLPVIVALGPQPSTNCWLTHVYEPPVLVYDDSGRGKRTERRKVWKHGTKEHILRNFRKPVANSELTSIRLSLHTEQRDPRRRDFHKISFLRFLINCPHIIIMVKIREKYRLTFRRTFTDISPWLVFIIETMFSVRYEMKSNKGLTI
jgi:hypothetical protein